MLLLNAAQVQALQAIRRQRQVALLSRTLADAFPQISARLGERYPLLIDLGVQRGTAHGLTHLLCLARYLACWCVLGAEFETKPGYAWAASLLGAAGRSEGAKAFQLCRRTREELARLAQASPAPVGLMPVAAFDQALASLDAALMQGGTLGALLPGAPLQLGEACDIDAIELRLLEPQALALYQLRQGQWQRSADAPEREPIVLRAAVGETPAGAGAGAADDDGSGQAGLPPVVSVLAPPGSGQAARLRIRTVASHRCDPDVHPVVGLNGPLGGSEWRGAPSASIVVPLFAPIAAPPATALQPTMAAETPAEYSVLSFDACGMRSDGTPIGSPSTQIAVRSAEQHLLAWQRTPGPAVAWPGEGQAGGRSRVRLERDGTALEAARWQAGLDDLDRRLMQGLSRLATAWERESGVAQGRLEAEPRLLAGQAALTWGWCESARGLSAPPFFRVAAQVDLIACQLDLRLSGVLALQGSTSRLQLHCHAAETLRWSFERRESDADLAAALAAAQLKFRLPFVLSLHSVAGDEPAVVDASSPLTGALVGSCGLRPRADGVGLQWFATLSVEPVGVVLTWHDPLLGEHERLHPLLPAMTLLDWSLG